MANSPVDTLGQLFTGLYGKADSSLPEVADSDLADMLAVCDPLTDDLVTQLMALLAGKRTLSVRQTGIVRVSASLLSDYFAQPVFHPSLAQHLLASSSRLIAEALVANGWLMSKQHPVHELLSMVAEVAFGWYPDVPQAAEIQQQLRFWLEGQAKGESGEQRLARAKTWLADFNARQAKVSERVAQSESGGLRQQYALQVVARTMNRQLAGRQLPDFMIEDVSQHWSAAFQWVLLQHGEGTPEWQKLVRGFGMLVWSVQPEASAEAERGKLSRIVDQIRQELVPLLDQIIADESIRARLRDNLEIAHVCQLHNRPLSYGSVPSVAGGSVLDNAGASISKDLLDEVAAVRVGDWFVEADSGRRLRLLLKLDEYQQLLFVNQLGMKLVSSSFEEFAWQFSSARISTVVAPVVMLDWVTERLSGLAEQYRARKKVHDAAQKEQQEAQQKIAAQREQARQKALLEARQLEEEKERHEAEQSAMAEAEKELERARREAAAVDHGISEAQRKQRARLLVSGLTMGAWLTFHDDDGVETRRKLAVVLPSSGKYIFVDRIGVEKTEITREALIAGIADGAIDVVRKDSRFDDALNRVVDGIRQDRGWG
ncbi:MAG: hypothetical protein CVV10_00275 [Gammaproteobacteria bacterium HGW-Gammaproteobacteria-14]|nr:MAG: hypothetical protein CVV10_00275 [Gammaproteobacteria bacterium HGW-Gammaproteobacteria-14]